MVKECLLNPSLQWSNPRPIAERLKRFQHLCASNGWKHILSGARGASGSELDEGDEWAPTLANHTVSTELGIPYGRRLLGERSHRSSLSRGKPSTWRRMTGLEASEREGMRDAVSRPEWMSRSGKRYTPKGVRTVWGGADGKGLVFDTTWHARQVSA